MSEAVFFFLAAFTLASALVVVLNNQLLYSAIALLFTLFGVAGMYIFLWADFIAGVQLLVYIGGINVLIIFGIMLTKQNLICSIIADQSSTGSWRCLCILDIYYYFHCHFQDILVSDDICGALRDRWPGRYSFDDKICSSL